MGFTVEELDQMQADLEGAADTRTPEEIAAAKVVEDAAAAKKAEEDKATADAEAKKKAEEEAAKAGVKKDEKTPAQIAEEEAEQQRQADRQEKKELQERLDKAEAANAKLTKVLKEKGLIGEEEEKVDEKAASDAKAAYDARVASLDILLEAMRVSPAFQDVDTVVSQSNFDDMVEGLASFYVEKNPGADPRQVAAKVTSEIWAMPNPYRYMYDMIKKHHPKFVKAEETAEEKKKREDKEAEEKKKKEEKKPEEKAPSLQDLPAGDTGAGGWTAARIDDLPEDELKTVPKDIYEKWLKGTLK
jgi:hypothetical protein